MALSQQQAIKRTKIIKQESIKYIFNISLQKGKSYQGLAFISFQIESDPQSLFLDFKGTLQNFIINGNSINIQDAAKQQGFIRISSENLQKDANQIIILYKNNYDYDGSGCVSFTDVDQKQYIYTQFAPYYANRVFPCFDQPDLKAPMALNIICPSHWKRVLSNEYSTFQGQYEFERYIQLCSLKKQENHKEIIEKYLKDKTGKMVIFPQTKYLSSYLFCFLAGDYQQMKLGNTYKNIPMSLFCIQSLYKQMEVLAPFINQITNCSMQFYEQYFGFPFSFNKYDQVFAHQFKWGAMQNAGIVTINDRLLFKQKVSNATMHRLANTISHQLSHHWFGNLVTMKWWDDLWLNQSFADFISHFCLSNINKNLKTIKFESSMSAFADRKNWGYQQDQSKTTHPIRGSVANTSVADSLFDGITYSKGAATIKQLMFIIKQENFSNALKSYFHKFSFKNAQLNDFIFELQKQFEIKEFTLENWKKEWLQTCSLNQMQVLNTTFDNQIIRIKQEPFTQNHTTLRHHKIKIAIFKQNLQIQQKTVVIYPQQITQVKVETPHQEIKAILLNYEDHSFMKTILDKNSRLFFSQNLTKISDILTRNLIWKSFYEMVKDRKMISDHFVEAVINNVSSEPSDSIFEQQLGLVQTVISLYTPAKYQQNLYQKCFNFVLNQLKKIEIVSENRVIVLREKLFSFASNYQQFQILQNWLNKTLQCLNKYQLTIAQEWSIVILGLSLKEVETQKKQKLLELQTNKDPSDLGKLKIKTCEAILANQQQFQNLYNQYKSSKSSMSIAVRNASASGWMSKLNNQRAQKYEDRYYKDILQASKQMKGDHLITFIRNLKPNNQNFQKQIEQYSKINFEDESLTSINIFIKKTIGGLKLRKTIHQFYLKSKQVEN